MHLFISVEGGEWVGKTSLVVPSLAEIFKQSGWQVLTSHEPGSTLEGKEIRSQIFRLAKDPKNAKKITLLLNQARKIHIDTLLKPFFIKHEADNAVIILDRYLDSTRVYQGYEGNVEFDYIHKLEREYVGDFFPDITFILYFPQDNFTELITSRHLNHNNIHKRRDETVWDKVSIEKHLQRQNYYLALPKLSRQRGEMRKFYLINAGQTPEKVVSDCNIKLQEYL